MARIEAPRECLKTMGAVPVFASELFGDIFKHLDADPGWKPRSGKDLLTVAAESPEHLCTPLSNVQVVLRDNPRACA